jgi:branched-chain amino acid transport system ATP-binding protein
VEFNGASPWRMKPHEINQAGVSRAFQTPEIFGDLSLVQNVMFPPLPVVMVRFESTRGRQ